MYSVFFLLLVRDIRIVCGSVFSSGFDALIWPLILAFVNGYLMPELGLSTKYASFILIGSIVVGGIFNALQHGQSLITDISGSRRIFYEVTLPLPTWLIWIKTGIVFAVHMALLNMLMVPLGMIVLGKYFTVTFFSWWRWIAMYAVVHLFLGFFGMWLASFARNVSELTSIRVRVILPLWILGGYQFPWKLLFSKYPTLALLNLGNPMVYLFEGLRAAALGQNEYIPFYISMLVLVAATVGCAVHAIIRFRRRLDFL